MCQTEKVKNIKRNCRNIVPGLKNKVHFSFMEELLNGALPPPVADKHLISTDIPMRVASGTGATAILAGTFKSFSLADKGNNYKDEPKGEGLNTYYLPEWDLTIEGTDEDKTFSLNAMNGATMCVIAPDNEGRNKVCANVQVTFGEMIDDSKNIYSLKVRALDKMKDPCYFYSGAIPNL
jgi:hypothetical protein